MDPLSAVFVGGGILLGLGLVVAVGYVQKQRAEALNAWMREHSFTPDPNVAQFEARMELFKLFNQGHWRQVQNLMRGERDGLQVVVCDYRYAVRRGGGADQRRYAQTICAVTATQPMPPFFLRRQVAVFDSLGKLLGGQDVNFEEAPQFSKEFVLQTDGDEAELRRFFNEPTRDAFSRLASKGIQAEAVGGTLLIHYSRSLGLDGLDDLVADAVNLRRVLMR